jgi:hypothetical protein
LGDIAAPADATSGKPFTVGVVGDLTVHGVTKLVTIPVQGQLGADGPQVVGSQVPMSMFDITPPNIGGFVTVEPAPPSSSRSGMKRGSGPGRRSLSVRRLQVVDGAEQEVDRAPQGVRENGQKTRGRPPRRPARSAQQVRVGVGGEQTIARTIPSSRRRPFVTPRSTT